ncbi:hypothetical protein [Collimonas humicola]|nr:hypothetical protein [Collimonas humicola]
MKSRLRQQDAANGFFCWFLVQNGGLADWRIGGQAETAAAAGQSNAFLSI